ncbi:MAG TPA: aminotransferase class I/II-fold pyridoxal phosphate-dependent enzyme [Fimbriimonadales bacterium]|nr:aminotransferase class I/II-fold pyridoxal phosphate-dependent enzyme [Fimbriimonadales bacterium]
MNRTLQTWLDEQLQLLKDQHLYKVPRILQTPAGGRVRMNGKEVVNLSSNNYLGLANHPKLREAAIKAIEKWGVGAGAVRWIGGTMSVHDELEQKLAEFKQVEAVLVFQSGWTANSGTIPAIMVEGDVIISDELNHASIIDGVRLSNAEYRKSEGWVYRHKDMNHLEDILKRANAKGFKKKMIVTDGVFSMDGDIAPLPDIVRLAEQYDAFVMVDDAHASGVLGKNGAGTTSHFNLYGRVDIQLGTLSKALGVMGGYIAGSKSLKEWLINRGRPYLFSTAHPPMVAAALIAAIEIMQTDPEPMRKLWDNARWWKSSLQKLGFDTMGSETPITPILCAPPKSRASTPKTSDASTASAVEASGSTGSLESLTSEEIAGKMEQMLWEEGVYALSIVYPTVPRGLARIRTMPSAAHTREDLEFALAAFEKCGRKLGLI